MKPATSMGALIGSTVGGLVPNLWGASTFSFSALFLSAFGAMIGIYVAFKMTR